MFGKLLMVTAFVLLAAVGVSAQSIQGQLTFPLGKFSIYLNPQTGTQEYPMGVVQYTYKGEITFLLPSELNNIQTIAVSFYDTNYNRKSTYDKNAKRVTFYRNSSDFDSFVEMLRLGTAVQVTVSTDPMDTLQLRYNN